ncbi:MAG: TolC family protein [Cyclobacteriaceae bacterium]
MMKSILLSLMLFAIVLSVSAQNPDSLRKASPRSILTFEQAIAMAMKNAVLLNTQRNNLEQSQMQKLSSIAGALPSVTLNSSASQFNGNSFNSQTGSVVNGIRDNVSGSINMNMNLFTGFSRVNAIRQYSALLNGQAYYVKRTAQDAMNTVATQYLQVMVDEELMRIAKENWITVDKLLQQISEQVKLGAKGPVDEFNQGALTKAAELTYIQAQITWQNDKALLAQTLLMDPFIEFQTEAPSWDINLIGKEMIDPTQMAESAKKDRPDYLRALENEKGYKYAMYSARGQMMPSLSAFFNYASSYNYQHNVPRIVDSTYQTVIVSNPAAASGYSLATQSTYSPHANSEYPQPFSQQFKRNNVYKQYGFQLSIPLFQGLQNRNFYVQQKVLYENAVVQRQSAEMQIRNDVVRAVRNFEGAKKTFSISSDKLEYAQAAMDLESQRFMLGVTSFVEYANANKVLVQAQTDKAQAEYRLVFQKVMLAYAAGTLKSEDIPQQR